MVARRQSNWLGPKANHKETHGLIKEQHMFDFFYIATQMTSGK
jgi:hypothetical protein